MLTIKDLHSTKDIDHKEMSGISGGNSALAGLASLSILSPINAPNHAEIAGITSSHTGPVVNGTTQDDRDVLAADSGMNFNLGGNTNFTHQGVTSVAATVISNSQ